MHHSCSVAIVLTGLPASGKSTLAKRLGQHLHWPVLDKDDFLETLFAAALPDTMDQRRRLSIQADNAFRMEAERHDQAVLVSHWRPRTGPTNTGTPVAWLSQCFSDLIEVHCACPTETAIARFQARRRHPGHLDATRDEAEIATSIRPLAGGYPLGIGQLLSVDTESQFDEDALLNDIKAMLGKAGESVSR